jgi:hypothetical protein
LRTDTARYAAEAFVVLDRFDVEQRRADRRPLAQPGKVVLDTEMEGVADRHDRGERQARALALSMISSARAPDWKMKARPLLARRGAGRQVAQEGGGDAPGRIETDDAGTIRPGDREAARRGKLGEFLVALRADRPRLGEAAGQDEQVFDAAAASLAASRMASGRMMMTARSTGGSMAAIEVTDS